MLYDADWIRFFLRTITPSVELVPPKSLALFELFAGVSGIHNVDTRSRSPT